MTEAETRAQKIDQQLECAGWRVTDHSMVGTEIPVDQSPSSIVEARVSYGVPLGTGFTDYCLYTTSGEGGRRTARL